MREVAADHMEGFMASTMQGTPKKRTTARRTSPSTVDESRFATHDEIARRARELYEESGYQSGRDVEFWLEAERQLRDVLKD